MTDAQGSELATTPTTTEPQDAMPYDATPAPPSPEDLLVQEARKQTLRLLDTKVSQEDEASALQAISLALKLAKVRKS